MLTFGLLPSCLVSVNKTETIITKLVFFHRPVKQDVIRPQQGCGEVPVVVTAEGCSALCLHRGRGLYHHRMFCVNSIQWPLQALGIQRKEEGAEAVAPRPQHQGEGSLEEEASLCQMQSTVGSGWERPKVWD